MVVSMNITTFWDVAPCKVVIIALMMEAVHISETLIYFNETTWHYVKWVHCHHSMVHPRVSDRGEGLQIWRVATNMLNKQSRTADSGWSSSLGFGRGANNFPPPLKLNVSYESLCTASEQDGLLGTT
jgi:hypothetical protein